MPRFETELIIKPLDEPRHFELVEELVYESGILGVINVPMGFDTDGASIPVGFRWLFPFGGKKMKPAVIHDYLYRTGQCSKEDADKVFKEAMECQEVEEWRISAMYNAVKYFGGKAWRENVMRRA